MKVFPLEGGPWKQQLLQLIDFFFLFFFSSLHFGKAANAVMDCSSIYIFIWFNNVPIHAASFVKDLIKLGSSAPQCHFYWLLSPIKKLQKFTDQTHSLFTRLEGFFPSYSADF